MSMKCSRCGAKTTVKRRVNHEDYRICFGCGVRIESAN